MAQTNGQFWMAKPINCDSQWFVRRLQHDRCHTVGFRGVSDGVNVVDRCNSKIRYICEAY